MVNINQFRLAVSKMLNIDKGHSSIQYKDLAFQENMDCELKPAA